MCLLSLCVLGPDLSKNFKSSIPGGSRVTDRNGHVTRTNGNGFPYNKCSLEWDTNQGMKAFDSFHFEQETSELPSSDHETFCRGV